MSAISRRLKAVALLCASAMLAGNAHAFIGAFVYAKVKTESEIIAGLDEKTRNLIEGLPANLRAEAIKALQEAQPLIDKSVAKYLDDVDTRIANRIDQAGCVAVVTADIIVEKIKGPWGEKTPITTLKRDYDTRKHFDPRNVENLALTYADLVGSIVRTGCGVYDTKAKAVISEFRSEVGQKMDMWHQIRNYCKTPDECLVMRYSDVRNLIANSEQRDLDFTNARTAFEKVKGVPVSRVRRGFFGGQSLDWTIDEGELVKLYVIDRSIENARALRSQNAKLYARDAGSSLAKAEETLALATSKLHPSIKAQNDEASKVADATVALRAGVVDNANAAIASHADQKPEGERILARFAQIEREAASVKAKAKANNDAIDAKAAQEAAKEAARKAEQHRWEQLDRMSVK